MFACFVLALTLALVPASTPDTEALGVLRRFVVAVETKDLATLAGFVPPGAEFPISLRDATSGDGKGGVRRKTYNHEAVQRGEVPFPACAAARDALACDAPRPSGRVTCTCSAAARSVEYDFMLPTARMPELEVQLVSIREHVSK